MKAPKLFYRKQSREKGTSFSLCRACGKWVRYIAIFFHEGRLWHLCEVDYFDYWENTDELLDDYKEYK